jgi:uncharacterized membrane protein
VAREAWATWAAPQPDGYAAARGCELASRLGALLGDALLVLYPVLVYFGIRYLGVGSLAVVLMALFALRLATSGSAALRPSRAQLAFASIVGIALALVSLLQRRPDAMLYYPVLVNGGLLAVFALSLARPPTVIERIARLTDGQLSAAAVAYTRRVTIAWVVFFACNGGVALFTARWTSIETWTFYNGGVSYVLIGIMIGAEWLVRRRVQRRAAK